VDDRLLPGGCGVAPPPQLDPRLLEAAIRLWQGGGAARGQMAATVQRTRAYRLGRADLLLRAWARQPAAAAYLPRRLGCRAVPNGPPTGDECRAFAVGHARMVPCGSAPRAAYDRRGFIDTVAVRLASIRASGCRAHRRGRYQRRTGVDGVEVHGLRAARPVVRYHLSQSFTAACSARRSGPPRADAVALASTGSIQAAAADLDCDLVGALARAGRLGSARARRDQPRGDPRY